MPDIFIAYNTAANTPNSLRFEVFLVSCATYEKTEKLPSAPHFREDFDDKIRWRIKCEVWDKDGEQGKATVLAPSKLDE